MKKIFFLAAFLLLSGCTTSRTPFFGAHKELPIELGNRSANACSVHLLGFIGSFGNNSIAYAARRAGIKKISYYEPSYDYYVLWGESCNTVYGY